MGVAAEGEDLTALFQQAALGVRQIITSSTDIQPRQVLSLEVHGQDLEELLVNWLGELLYLLEVKQFLPASFEIVAISEQQLHARVRGESIDGCRHELQREIKAVTYHQIEVVKTAAGWRTRFFVDL